MQFFSPYTPSPAEKERRNQTQPQNKEEVDQNPSELNKSPYHPNQKDSWSLPGTIKNILSNTCFHTSITSESGENLSNNNNNNYHARVHFNALENSMDIRSGDDGELSELLYKLLIIGDSSVGKTSMVQRYAHGKTLGNYKMTLGVDFALKVVKWSENISVKLQLWDIAGQERFTCMTRVYYKDAHACIIMFDLSQRQTFLNAMKWKADLDSKCALPDGSPIPCILLANKCDLRHREVEQPEIEAFCKDQDFIGWTEVSVKEGLMIEEAMKFLLEDMMQRYNDNTLPHTTTNSPNQNPTGSSRVKLSGESSQIQQDSKCKC